MDPQQHLQQVRVNNAEVKSETWLNHLWRPMMAWQYFIVCMFDFLVAPIMYATINVSNGAEKIIQWNPLTLQGGGLYHLAMGAVIGITAWSRGQEKIIWMHALQNAANQPPPSSELPPPAVNAEIPPTPPVTDPPIKPRE